MSKELYLYSTVYDFVAEALISQLEENKETDVSIRMNTNGGDPQAGYGVIAKMRERAAAGIKTEIKVDGKAYSTGFFMLLFASYASGLNVSSYVVHRAAYPSYYEPSEAEQDDLRQLNNDLREAMENKIDASKFFAVTGKTLDEVFDETKRIDVRLTSAQAKEIGLIDKVNNINDPQIAASINKAIIFEAVKTTTETKKEDKPKTKKMDKNKLKSEFPELYAEISNDGVTAERERVKSWMVFNDVDAKAVSAGINSGEEISKSESTDLTRKSLSAEMLSNLEKESTPETTPDAEAVKKTEADAKIAAFTAEIENKLDIKIK